METDTDSLLLAYMDNEEMTRGGMQLGSPASGSDQVAARSQVVGAACRGRSNPNHKIFDYDTSPPPENLLRDATVDDLRLFCTTRKVQKWKGKNKEGLVMYIQEWFKHKQELTNVIEAVAASSTLSGVAASGSGAVTLAQRRLLKWNKEFRLLNVLYGSKLYASWLATGGKLTRLELDAKKTGIRADVWAQAAAEFNTTLPNPEYDTLVPRTGEGVHPFLRDCGIDPGALTTQQYTGADVYGTWKEIQMTFKGHYARFDSSGNHDLNEESFKNFVGPTDKTPFYLYQWTLVRPDSLCFASASLPKGFGVDSLRSGATSTVGSTGVESSSKPLSYTCFNCCKLMGTLNSR
eukprot:GHVU01106245.1.p1 GENE.GHVU01106245.1~~GHVU01106245.1.p1  ORF type:complete len:349 (-),score=37.49 GHVU01106245.1:671-1717(-)